MREGDVSGHEFMGEVVRSARSEEDRGGDRVVAPSFIGCGTCWYCDHDHWALCDNTNPNPELRQPALGYPTGGSRATRTPSVAMPGRTPSSCVFHTPTRDASAYPRACATYGPADLKEVAPPGRQGSLGQQLALLTEAVRRQVEDDDGVGMALEADSLGSGVRAGDGGVPTGAAGRSSA